MQRTQRRVLSSVTLALLTALWGWSAGAQTTERVSVASDGTEGNDASLGSALSADGRFVAFDSAASDLVAADTNGVSDVFVHDRQTGATERVSVDSAGTQANGSSFGGALSADGRFVAFTSAAPDLVAGDTNGAADVFVHDRGATAADQITDLPTLARSCYLQPKGVETSMVRKLQNALAAVNAGDLATACTLLSDFRDCSPGFWWHLGDRWREALHRSARIRNPRRLEITWCSCIRLPQHV